MISCVRRTSIVTESMEQSLKFYKEGIGMKVFYDNVIESEVSGKLMNIDNPKVHLVSLQSGDEDFGMIGLMKFINPENYSTREEFKASVGKTDIVLVYRTDDVDSIYKRLIELEFTPRGPFEYEIPQRGRVRAMSCEDPNGVLCEFTQYL